MLWFVAAVLCSTPALSASDDDAAFMPIIPAPSAAVTDDAFSLLWNPAGLGVHQAFEAVFLHRQGFDMAPLSAESFLVKAYGLGLGFDKLIYEDQESDLVDLNRFNIGLAPLSYRNMLFAGMALQVYDPGGGPVSLGWSAGLMYRPWRYLSVGLSGRNLGNVKVADIGGINPRWDMAVAVRPGTERVTLSADMIVKSLENWVPGDSGNGPDLVFRAQFEPIDGLAVVGRADVSGEFSIGLAVDFSHFGGGLFTWVRKGGVAGAAYITARADTSESLLGRSPVWLRMDVDETISPGAAVQEMPLLGPSGRSLLSLVSAIDKASRQEFVKGLVLVIGNNRLGPADLQEIGAALVALRGKGKKVVAYLEDQGPGAYMLALCSDKILMPPQSSLSTLGTKLTTVYYKDLLDKLGLVVEAEKAEGNDYKSGPEKYTRSGPSRPALEAYEFLVKDLYDQFVEAVSRARGIEPGKVAELIDKGPYRAEEAKELGLVDAVEYLDEVPEFVRKTFGSAARLVRQDRLPVERNTGWGPKPRIAVIDLKGVIVDGKGGQGLFGSPKIGSSTASAAVEQAAADPTIDALVLRVDSPGGSGFASDQIWHRLRLASKRKPLVASMGNMAASGGYYISCGADTILADPWTITGSIGAFSLRLDASGLLSKLGIGVSTVKKGTRADLWTSYRPATKEERARIRSMVTSFYNGFLAKAAACRNMDVRELNKVARGRPWTGRAAKDLKLVDELGGLWEAVRVAKEKASIPDEQDVEVVVFPKKPVSLGALVKRIVYSEQEDSAPDNPVGPLVRQLGFDPGLLDLLLYDSLAGSPLALSTAWFDFSTQ